MMLIIKIEVQQENRERLMIHALKENGERFSFSVDQNVLIEFRLKKGMEVDEFTFQEIVYADEVKKAYQIALHFLSYRMRSEQEVVNHLKKKGKTEAVIRDVLHELRKHQYVNDEEFAHAYVQTQIKTTLKGPAVIRRELEGLGIAEDLIEQALLLLTEDRQLEAAKKLYEKAMKQTKHRSAYEWKQYIEQLLQRKGFPRWMAQKIADEHAQAPDEAKEWEALEHHARKAHRRYQAYNGLIYDQKMKQALYRKGFSLEKINEMLNKLKEEENQ
ncbi:recombination regulator RecX [Anoxybacillus sp. B7M1]|uniref:recombination regulator RecX n=1 Tax=unclassified Anoxybacillus TaxID=2639704 RepID=UPI0005CD6F54|nr:MULTISPECIES: recombination regulator RecX [unclassified Anoxybacillus]